MYTKFSIYLESARVLFSATRENVSAEGGTRPRGYKKRGALEHGLPSNKRFSRTFQNASMPSCMQNDSDPSFAIFFAIELVTSWIN